MKAQRTLRIGKKQRQFLIMKKRGLGNLAHDISKVKRDKGGQRPTDLPCVYLFDFYLKCNNNIMFTNSETGNSEIDLESRFRVFISLSQANCLTYDTVS